MYFRVCIFLFFFVAAATAPANRAYARTDAPNNRTDTPSSRTVQPPKQFTPDSARYQNSERYDRLYDSIRTKTSRRRVPRMLYQMLFVKPQLDTTADGRVLNETQLIAPYAGRKVGDIIIEQSPIFEPGGNWLTRTADNTHIQTRERVIRRDLLFRTGDRLDPQLVVRNKQLLRSRPYLSDADILIVPDSIDSMQVNVLVRTRDSWTISIDAALHAEGHTMLGISDANILGTGNLLNIETNFSRKNFDYGGNVFEYEIPNVLGTFFTAGLSAGRNFYNSIFDIGLNKEFIRPTDYEVGLSYINDKSKRYLVAQDTSLLVRQRDIDAWGGYSHYLPGIRSSVYFTAHYNNRHFFKRPFVDADYNPALHNQDVALAGLGLYREQFYSASMIYGFGTREFLPSGYKAEIVSGYSWGEFSDDLYLGASVRTGGFRSMGYIMGGFTLGSYIDLNSGMWRQSAVDVDLRWFSNLFLFRRNRIRQFLALNYTQGWNRTGGNDEMIRFTDENGLQTLREYVTGTNRAVLNTETVLFTPFQPLGFRFALFGFADFGLIGNSANPFHNSFFTSLGAGVRIKNERLIFSTIQIQLGVALGKHGLTESRYFRVSNSNRVEEFRYLPSRPEIVGFQ